MAARHRTSSERQLWMRLRDRYELIAYMEQRSLSVRELARWAHCHPSTIGHLRTGHMTTCSARLAARIEKALGVEPGRLFEPKTMTSSSSVTPTTNRRGAA
jgi:helix-turn-helix protein